MANAIFYFKARQCGIIDLISSCTELRFDDIDKYVFSDTIRDIATAAAIDEAKFVNRNICQSFSMDVILDTRHY